MKRLRCNAAAVIGLAAPLALAGPDAAVSGVRLHGEPSATGFTLSCDGSKMIVLHKRDRQSVLDIVDTRSGASLGLSGHFLLSLRWGEDSDDQHGSPLSEPENGRMGSELCPLV